jgi:hypothetical protein
VPLNLGQLVAVGSDAFVARRLELGEDITDIRVALRREFPEASEQTVYAAYFRGAQAFQAGALFSALADDQRIPASEVPRPLEGRLNWRYAVRLQFGTSQGGVEDYRYAYLNEPASITAGEVRTWAESVAQSMLGELTGNKHYIPDAPGKVFLGADVILVSRS